MESFVGRFHSAMEITRCRDVWCYYYSDFPLVHIRDRRVTASWNVPVHGARAFAIDGSRVLFAGTYDTRDALTLCTLAGDRGASVVGTYTLATHGAEDVALVDIVGRGSRLYALRDQAVSVIDLQDVLIA